MSVFLHCAKCVKEAVAHRRSPGEYARLEVSIEEEGLLIMCVRHSEPVALLTPNAITKLMEETPLCELCQRGIPHAHERKQ